MKKRASRLVRSGVRVALAMVVAFGLLMGAGQAPAAAATSTAATTAVLTPVTVLLDWAPNTNHTGLYVAQEKGFFRDQGLDVKIVQPGEGASAESLVAAGKVDFAVSFVEWLVNARLSGIPAVSVAAILQHNTSAFASVKSKKITRPRDFEGKKYGGEGLPMERAILAGLMKADGGDVSRLKFVSVGVSDLLTLLQRDIDVAWIYYGWEGIEAQLRGIPLNTVMLSDWDRAVPDVPSPILITGERTVREKPDLVRRFLTATARGYEFTVAHPDEAADLLVKSVPEMDPKLAQASQRWLSPRYKEGAKKWGEQKSAVWQRFADWLYENKLANRKLDTGTAFTNEFLPE
ncbi:MAG: ABC transporter substrate-binding protein [Firmicutes bacterium]|nr:ABC transporter substrate-binding protein [Bacillota bacterium]